MPGQGQDAQGVRNAAFHQETGFTLNHTTKFATTAFAVALLIGCSGGDAGDEKAETAKAGLEPPVTRPAPRDSEQVAAAHILFQYAGVRGAPEGLARTRDEALEMARDAAERARAGEDFGELAKSLSDGPSRNRGGNVGVVSKAGGAPPEFFDAVLALDYEGVSEPVESAFGVHVIRRYEVEIASARHILVSYKGAMRASPEIERTRDEAMERCAEILDELKDGADFAELATEKSDGPTSVRGGNLGTFVRGRMDQTFDDAVFALEVGEMSGTVETPFGCHIILRYEPEPEEPTP